MTAARGEIVLTTRVYPKGVTVFYDVVFTQSDTKALYRHVRGGLPARFWDDEPAHVHLDLKDTRYIRQLMCIHGGSMNDCIERADARLHELYVEEDPEWLKSLKIHKRKTPVPMSLTPRIFAPSGRRKGEVAA